MVDVTAMVAQGGGRASGSGRPQAASELDLDLPHRPVVMTTNGSMLEKIIANLVSNAVRYSRDERTGDGGA